jgi:threonine dehydratase
MPAHNQSTDTRHAAREPLNFPAPNLTLDVIRAAHRLISPRIHRTPVITCASLNQIAGAQLFFKCENLQKTGSFKIRGATNAVFSLSDEQAIFGVAAPSSGNHAAALSQAARWRGIPAYIVMPRNSSQAKKSAVEAYGGQITESEPNIASREAVTAEVIKRTGAHLVHPYNDARVIAGQGTAALELLEEIPDIDVVITPLSGGGLLSGTAIAAKSVRPGIRVIGGEQGRGRQHVAVSIALQRGHQGEITRDAYHAGGRGGASGAGAPADRDIAIGTRGQSEPEAG